MGGQPRKDACNRKVHMTADWMDSQEGICDEDFLWYHLETFSAFFAFPLVMVCFFPAVKRLTLSLKKNSSIFFWNLLCVDRYFLL